MKKIILLVSLMLTLTACGGKTDTPKTNNSEAPTTKEETVEATEAAKDDKSGTVEESDIGKIEIIKQKKDINDIYESGPMKFTIEALQIAKFTPNEDSKEMFDGKDELTVITMQAQAENMSDDTISFYPDQSTIVTNTKEQKTAEVFFSDEVGGDFIGKVIKKGEIFFFLDSNPDEINNLKFVIDAAHNQNLDSVGESIEFNYDI